MESNVPDAQKPNILILITDQQSYDMMSCAGNRWVNTPAMDRLAAEGVRFDRAYCTIPVCVPSRFALMTGRYATQVDMRSNNNRHVVMPPEIPADGFGWKLQKAGYRCVYGGKTHLPKMTPQDLGFETYCTDQRQILADQTADWLGEHGNEGPFCMVTSLINPHDICMMAIREFATTDFDHTLVRVCTKELEMIDKVLQRPEGVNEEEFFARYCPPLPPNFEVPECEAEAVQELMEERPFRRKAREQWSENRWREHRWAYARLTEIVDAEIGRVMEGLERAGLADNTVVILTSDHGDMDSTYRMEHKTFFCDKASRIPMIVRDPRGVSGQVDAHIVNNGLDLVPTVLDYAGLPPADHLEGRSLRPLAQGRDEVDWRDQTYIVNQIGHAIVTDRYKYMVYDRGARREQLVDLVDDPYEMRNALHDPQHRQAVEDLRARMRQIPQPVDVPDDPL